MKIVRLFCRILYSPLDMPVTHFDHLVGLVSKSQTRDVIALVALASV